jgi:hypothetical protein
MAFLKNLIIGIFLVSFLGGCAQNAALLGPAYTLASTGNVYHAGFTYGGGKIVSNTTGKSVVQNFKEVITPKKEDTEFEKLVKRNIEETRRKLKLSSQ